MTRRWYVTKAANGFWYAAPYALTLTAAGDGYFVAWRDAYDYADRKARS